MQRRHDHPIAGRFLSVDPVVMDANTGKSLWRYHYGENSPSRYRDPDGRAVETPWDAANVAWGVASFAKNTATGNYAGAAIDAAGVTYDLLATGVPGLPGGASAGIRAAGVVDKVASIGSFFKATDFGKAIAPGLSKTSKQFQGRSVYKVTSKVDHAERKKGDPRYPDAKHKDHIEVFDKSGNAKAVLNLDGTVNQPKTAAAFEERRRLK